MKKRLLSMLLLVATIVTALPLVTFSIGATEVTAYIFSLLPHLREDGVLAYFSPIRF